MSGDGDGIEVIGGVGGTRATLGSLMAAVGRLESAARSLDTAAAAAASAGAHAPGAAADAFERLVRGPTGLLACADRASGMAADVRTAVQVYEDADRRATARMVRAIMQGAALGEAGPLAWLLLGQWTAGLALVTLGQLVYWRSLRFVPGGVGTVWRLVPDLSGVPVLGRVAGPVTAPGGLLPDGFGLPTGEEFEPAVLWLAAFVLAAAPGEWHPHGRPVQELAARMAVLGRAWQEFTGLPERGLVVAPLLGDGRRDERDGGVPGACGPGAGSGSGAGDGGRRAKGREQAPTDLEDVVSQVAALSDLPSPTIEVQRLDHADGTTSWVVSVPGTRSMDVVPGAIPMDNATNLALMAGTPDDMTHAVQVAMLRAGVGPDEPVLIAGHSQGGMVATRLASSLRDTYSIAAVVTAGSPVGAMEVPRDVAALHLEHAQDWVPALDGTPTPDRLNRTTVVRTLPGMEHSALLGTVGTTPGDLGDAHEAWRYAETAALVDDLDDPSVEGFRDALEGVLGDGTARVTSRRYLVAREG